MGTTVGQGENLHRIYEFEMTVAQCDPGSIQPDASNCGGITGRLQVAALTKGTNIAICSLGAQGLHASLVSAQPHAGWIELRSFPIDRYRARPHVPEKARVAPDAPGIGVTLDWQRLTPFDVAA